MARPIIQIDWSDFDKLCGLQCTLEEIASFFDCSADTIERACKREKKVRFAEYYGQKSQKGRISLRRKMYEMATGGNVVMLIWLSKQYLGFADKVESKTEIEQKGDTIYRVGFQGETNSIAQLDPTAITDQSKPGPI